MLILYFRENISGPPMTWPSQTLSRTGQASEMKITDFYLQVQRKFNWLYILLAKRCPLDFKMPFVKAYVQKPGICLRIMSIISSVVLVPSTCMTEQRADFSHFSIVSSGRDSTKSKKFFSFSYKSPPGIILLPNF